MLRTIAAATLLLLAGCERTGQLPVNQANASAETPGIAPILTSADAVDPHSYARPREARVHHVALDLGVDFDAKRLGGTATLDIERKPDAKEIVLDSDGLEIESITDGDGQPLQFRLGAADEALGAPLTVALWPDTKRLIIRYKSAPGADLSGTMVSASP